MTWTRSNSGSEGCAGARPALACLVALVLAGCSQDRLGTPDTPGDPVPKTAPRTVGAPRVAGEDERKLIAAFGGAYSDAKATALLEEVTARLVAASSEPAAGYKIAILNSPTVNAFSLPDGHLYVTRGLLALAGSTSEIAAVLAHEMAHVIARHAIQRVELEKSSALFSKVASEVLNDPTGGQKLQEQSRVSLASFSRQQEFEADSIGIRMMAKANYDPYGAARFLESLARYAAMRSAAGGGSGRPDMFSTHPATQERVQMAIRSARQLNAPGVGEDDRARYLAAIDGISFGDDPSQGIVKGRNYFHTRFGIGFTAPEGFVLSAGAEAVQGSSAATGRAMRFDTVEVPLTTSLPQYLQSGWIEGVEVTKETTLDIGPLVAETGLAKSGEWTFRLAAIRSGNVVYRMIFAAKVLTPEADQSFLRAVSTFHHLTAEEIARVRPLRLRVVTASASDSAATLAAAMSALGLPPDEFAVLNGLDKGTPVMAGHTYKAIAE